MFILVRLLNGLPEPLWYSVPTNYAHHSLAGLIVQVPVRNQIVPALVVDQFNKKPDSLTFILKDIHSIDLLPPDKHFLPFLTALSAYYQQDKLHFIKRIHHFLAHKKEDALFTTQSTTYSTESSVQLTDEQQKVSDFLTYALTKQTYTPTVLHGVTGSGKTEVYKHLFLQALAQGKTALLLLPEVTLAVAFENRLKQEMPLSPIHG